MPYQLQNLNNVETVDSAGNLNISGILTVSGISGSINGYAIVTANQTGILTGAFYPYTGNPSSFVLSSQTGNFLTSSSSNSVIFDNINISGSTSVYGGGIYTFTKTIPTGTLSSYNIFSISGLGGGQIFDVLVISTPSGFNVCKKYTVANIYGNAAPIYSVVLNSGPSSSNNDFTASFANTGSPAGVATLMSISSNQTGIAGTFAATLILGASPSSNTIVTAL